VSGLPIILAYVLDGGGGAYARMMTALLPPGKLWGQIQGFLGSLLLACSDELDRVHARVADLLNEADPSTAVEMLPEYELELGLAAAPSIAERQATVLARRIRRQRFRPAEFQAALAPLLALAPAAVVVIERTRAQVIAIGDDREIYRFFIYRDPSLPGSYFLPATQALVDDMAPNHTQGTVIESVAALYDDPHSLYDRDLMGT
jgi:hypothetical protein